MHTYQYYLSSAPIQYSLNVVQINERPNILWIFLNWLSVQYRIIGRVCLLQLQTNFVTHVNTGTLILLRYLQFPLKAKSKSEKYPFKYFDPPPPCKNLFTFKSIDLNSKGDSNDACDDTWWHTALPPSWCTCQTLGTSPRRSRGRGTPGWPCGGWWISPCRAPS